MESRIGNHETSNWLAASHQHQRLCSHTGGPEAAGPTPQLPGSSVANLATFWPLSSDFLATFWRLSGDFLATFPGIL